MAFDFLTYILALTKSKKYTNEQIAIISKGMTYKGDVLTINDLPLTNNAKGDLYSVKEDNNEYVWTIDATSGTLSNWERIGGADLSNFYTQAQVDALVNDKVVTVVADTNMNLDGYSVPSLSQEQVQDIISYMADDKVCYVADQDENDVYLVVSSLLEQDPDYATINLVGKDIVISYTANLTITAPVAVSKKVLVDTDDELVFKASLTENTIDGSHIVVGNENNKSTINSTSIVVQQDDSIHNSTVISPDQIIIQETNDTAEIAMFNVHGADQVNLTSIDGEVTGMKFVVLTEEEYDELEPDMDTFYIITE